MTQSINYAKLLNSFKHSEKEGPSYLLENEIKEEVLKMVRHYTFEMLGNPNNNDFFFHECSGLFDIDQIKLDIPDFFDFPIHTLKMKLKKSQLSAFDFMHDLNNLSQYDAYKEFDDDFTAFEKYCYTIAEFWLDELESIQDKYLIERDKIAAKFIAVSYLQSIYSPHTMLGRKRFDKERDALFN